MPVSIANKPQLTGILILAIGVALLTFTFVNAFLFLQEPLSILATGDLGRVFGDALAPLIQACIRLMYLGIMGWIGSMLTVRGIPLVTHRHIPVASTQAQTVHTQQRQTQPQPQVPPQPKAPVATVEQPKEIPQQPKMETPQQPQPPKAQPAQPTPQPVQEEPKAILIPPENQREE
jgi:predicted lipid-binding transport protein (Tim44 family)